MGKGGDELLLQHVVGNGIGQVLHLLEQGDVMGNLFNYALEVMVRSFFSTVLGVVGGSFCKAQTIQK